MGRFLYCEGSICACVQMLKGIRHGITSREISLPDTLDPSGYPSGYSIGTLCGSHDRSLQHNTQHNLYQLWHLITSHHFCEHGFNTVYVHQQVRAMTCSAESRRRSLPFCLLSFYMLDASRSEILIRYPVLSKARVAFFTMFTKHQMETLKKSGYCVLTVDELETAPREVSNIQQFYNRSDTRRRDRTIETVTSKLMSSSMCSAVEHALEEAIFVAYFSPAVINVGTERIALEPTQVAVFVTVALSRASKGEWKFAPHQPGKADPHYIYSKNRPVYNEHAASVADLCTAFDAIETSLIYHYTSSIQPIPFQTLRQKTLQYSKSSLTLSHIQQIITIYPDSYSIVSSSRGDYSIAANGIPHRCQQRKQQFKELAARWQNKAVPLNPLPENGPTSVKRTASDRLESLRKKPKMPTKPELAERSGSVLQRIRAKEASRAFDYKLKELQATQKTYDTFIGAQLTRICTILLSLQSRSYSLEQLLKILSDSLKTRLSPQESRDALDILSKRAPEFCTIVNTGAVRAIKLNHSGWTYNRLLSVVTKA